MQRDFLRAVTRRHFFKQSGFGIGGLALSALLDERLLAQVADGPLAPRAPHFAPKAKRIIYLFMAGAPSQLDLFDHKAGAAGARRPGDPGGVHSKGERFAFIKGTPQLLGSPFTFKRYGQSGAELSELLPHLATIADDIAIVRSMHTTQFNHAPGADLHEHRQPGVRPAEHGLVAHAMGWAARARDLPGVRRPALGRERA